MRRVRARVPTGPHGRFSSSLPLSSSLLLLLFPVPRALCFSVFPSFLILSPSLFNLFAYSPSILQGRAEHDELRFDTRQARTIVLWDCPVIRSYYHARETGAWHHFWLRYEFTPYSLCNFVFRFFRTDSLFVEIQRASIRTAPENQSLIDRTPGSFVSGTLLNVIENYRYLSVPFHIV